MRYTIMPDLFIELELCVMDMLLKGDDPRLATLRQQFERSTLRERRLTGVGFYVDFAVADDAPHLESREPFHIGDVEAQIEGLEHGAGFVLFVKDGVIDCLEGYCYDEIWAEEPKLIALSYHNSTRRNLPWLNK